MDSSNKIPRRTLEVVDRIGKRPMKMIVDFGSTKTCIVARQYMAGKLTIEKELDGGEELRMADSSVVRIEGRVYIYLKYGGYRGIVEAKVFPNMDKAMILGIPWLAKTNPHIDRARLAMAVQQGQEWISLPLASHKQDTLGIVLNQINVKMVTKMFEKNEVKGVFIGVIWSVEQPTMVQVG